jgi:hypothetical protein
MPAIERTPNVVTLGRLPSMLNWIRNIEERKKQLTDPSCIRMVDALIVHMQAEFDHDVSAAMATMTLDGYSRHWGGGPVLGALPRKIANSERGTLYQEMVRMSGEYAFKVTEMTDERFYVGPDGICSEGLLWNVVSGHDLVLQGEGELPDQCTEEDIFMVGRRVAIFMSYQGDKQVGEDVFFDGPAEILKIDRSLMPGAAGS